VTDDPAVLLRDELRVVRIRCPLGDPGAVFGVRQGGGLVDPFQESQWRIHQHLQPDRLDSGRILWTYPTHGDLPHAALLPHGRLGHR
jgi:hypothetical protein